MLIFNVLQTLASGKWSISNSPAVLFTEVGSYGHGVFFLLCFLILDRSCEVDEHKRGSLVRLGTMM